MEYTDEEVFGGEAAPLGGAPPPAREPTPLPRQRPLEAPLPETPPQPKSMLSDEDVFGPEPARAAGGKNLYTDADVFGPPETGIAGKIGEFLRLIPMGAASQVATMLQGGALSQAEPGEGEEKLRQYHREQGTQYIPPPSITEDPLYQLGTKVEKGVRSYLGLDQGVSLPPLAADYAQGLGSVAGNIATAFIPVVGPGLLVGSSVSGAQGEALNRAIQAKATPEQQLAAQSHPLAALSGASEFVDALLPMLGTTGKAVGFIRKVGLPALYAAFAEGGQEGLQQFLQNAIAKGVYKPNQDLFEDVAYSALVGAIVGGTVRTGLHYTGLETEGKGTKATAEDLKAALDKLTQPPDSGQPKVDENIFKPTEVQPGLDQWQQEVAQGIASGPKPWSPSPVNPETGVAQPTDRRPLQVVWSGTVSEVLDKIDLSHVDDKSLQGILLKHLTNYFKEVIGDVPIAVATKEQIQAAHFMLGPGVLGVQFAPQVFSDPRGQQYVLIRDDVALDRWAVPHILFHELTHAATTTAWNENKNGVRDQTQKMMDYVQSIMPDTLKQTTMHFPAVRSAGMSMNYGFTNGKEFLSELFSNPSWQAWMNTIEAPANLVKELGLEKPPPKLSMWQTLVRWVREKVFQFTPAPETYKLFDAAIRLGSRVMDTQAQMYGDKGRGRGVVFDQTIQPMADLLAKDGEDPGLSAMGIPTQPEVAPIITGVNAAFAGAGGTPTSVRQMMPHGNLTKYWYMWMAGLDQLVDANRWFTPLLRYYERVRAAHTEETKIQDAALRVAKRWRALGHERGENLTGFIDDLTNMRYRSPQEVQNGVGRHPTPAEFNALAAKWKLDQESLALFQNIKRMFDGFLQLNEQLAISEAIRLITDPVALANRIDAIRNMTRQLGSRPYFPFIRFGEYYVVVKDGKGRVTHFETFERRGLVPAQRSQRRAFDEMERTKLPGETVEMGKLPNSTGHLLGMPPLLLEKIAQDMQLTPTQLDVLKQLQLQYSPALSFRHRFQHKNYVPGYSMDFRRAFARYFFHGARFYARAKYAWQLRDFIEQAGRVPGNRAGEIRDYMQDHMDNTILDSRGDFGFFKGFIFLWALGYVPAAAFMNMTQTPLITFPFLSGKFGEYRAVPAILKAMSQLTTTYRKRGYYDPANVTDDELRALGYGIRTGRITETMAPELAGMAQGSNLLHGYGGNKLQQGWMHFMEKSAWMFEMAEQWNRRIAWRAAYNLAKQNPNNKVVTEAVNKYNDEYLQLKAEGHNEVEARAIVTAAHTVDQTQYVYSRYARPRFMRGPVKSTLFVFKKYIQSTLFMLGHNRSDVLPRYLLMSMLLGGIGGVPGYDDFKDLVKALGYWLFGKYFDVEKELRQYIIQLSDGSIPPDMVLHGLARRGMGVPAMLDMLGSLVTGKPGRGFDAGKSGQNIPFPVVDRSRALSMGNILPVELGKMIGPAKDINSTIAEQAQRASGAVFSVGFNIYKAIFDNKNAVTDPKRWERAIPRFLGNASRAFRAYDEGRERGRGGVASAPTIANFDPRDPEQMMEILAMGAGYQPLKVQAAWDRIRAQAEVTAFWDLQRKALLAQLFEAQASQNADERESVLTSIREFNSSLPDWARGKGITPINARQSMQARQRERAARESGVPTQRANRPIAEHIRGLFPENTVDVRKVQ